ncbi:conserved membrane hypothetical protein [Verrucomicrobia bacterium]|nr:conserved membrane hypothetical protein [Verrucomicrobiota bacterium]
MKGCCQAQSSDGAQVPPPFEAPRGASPAAWVLPALAATAGAVVLFLFDPNHSHFYPLCLFHQTTGLLCPGCGSLRSLHQLLHGHLAAALHYNALLVLSLPFLGWFGLRLVHGHLKNQPVQFHAAWFWLAFAALLVFGILRNLPFATRAWLAP